MTTWSENGENIFIVLCENKKQGNCIVAYRNKDKFLVAELLFFIPWQPRFQKCLYRNGEKLTKNAQSFPRQLVRFLFFTEVNGIPVCLVCPQQVSVVKKYNNRRHYETHHAERYRGLQGQPRREKVKELIASLKKQQPVFTSSRDISAAAVKASYLIANDIA